MARIRCFSNGAPSDSVKIRKTNKKKEKKKYTMFTVEKRWFHRAFLPLLSSPFLSSRRTTTNTRFLDKKKKEEKTHGVLIITGRVSSVLSTILLVPRCVTSLPPATIGGKGGGKLAERRVSQLLPPHLPPPLPQTFLYFGFR